MKLKLEMNTKPIVYKSIGSGIELTPPIEKSFWLMRVRVSKTQAIVAFPKFGVIGIGFQVETDWNTNLPSGSSAIMIYEHIKHNKGDARISRGQCIEAIVMLQQECLNLLRNETIENLKTGTVMLILGSFLRKTGSYQIAEAIQQ